MNLKGQKLIIILTPILLVMGAFSQVLAQEKSAEDSEPIIKLTQDSVITGDDNSAKNKNDNTRENRGTVLDIRQNVDIQSDENRQIRNGWEWKPRRRFGNPPPSDIVAGGGRNSEEPQSRSSCYPINHPSDCR
jgi:hypothetical protein